MPPGTKRREQDQAVVETAAREDEDAWLERMKNLCNMLDDAGYRSREEQKRHAELCDARRRETKFEVGSRVEKESRVVLGCLRSDGKVGAKVC